MKTQQYRYTKDGFEAVLYDAENGDDRLLISRLRRNGFAHSYKHINFENGSHNLGFFPVNNNLLPQEKKQPEECQKAREKALEIILQTLESWDTEQL